MNFRPEFVPKQRKWSYKIVVPFVLIALVAGLFAFRYFWQGKEDKDAFTVCNLKHSATKQLLKESNENAKELQTINITDYSYYGETLKLYENTYSPFKRDPLVGKTLFINNLCDESKEKETLLNTNELDVGLDISRLADGFYELEVLTDLDPQRLIAEKPIDEVFYSVKRDKKIKEVRIFSDKTIVKEKEEDILDKNYLFLSVKSIEDNGGIDIVLDPAGGNFNDNGTLNQGHFFNGISEGPEVYEIANKTKEILEAHGLRVVLSRDANNGINIYGPNGRIHGSYEAQANYYIHMRYSSSGSNMDRGLLALYSNFTSNKLATNIIKSLTDGTNFQASPYINNNNIPGVFRTNKNKGLDNDNIVRETGGLLTGAGIISPFDGLMPFAKDSRKGMHSINLLYGYMTNKDDVNVWKNEKDKIAESTAKGILRHLGIEYKGE